MTKDVTLYKAQLTLVLIFLVVSTTIGFWDAWAMFTDRPEATVSSLVRDWSHKWPVLPFALGCLAGHLFL
jgi:hypothetical protein